MTVLDDIDSGKYSLRERLPEMPRKPCYTPVTKEQREQYDLDFCQFEVDNRAYHLKINELATCSCQLMAQLQEALREEFSLDAKTAKKMFAKACVIENITRVGDVLNTRKLYEIFEVLAR